MVKVGGNENRSSEVVKTVWFPGFIKKKNGSGPLTLLLQ